MNLNPFNMFNRPPVAGRPEATLVPVMRAPAGPKRGGDHPPASQEPPQPAAFDEQPRPRPARVGNLEGIEAAVLEIAERNGWTIRLEGFERHRLERNRIFTTIAQPHGLISNEKVCELILNSGVKFDADKLTRLAEIKMRAEAQHAEIMRWAFLPQNYARIIAEDETKVGTVDFMDLTHNRTRVQEICAGNLSRAKQDLKLIVADASPILVELGELVYAVIEQRLAGQIEADLRVALQWGLSYSPTFVVASIASLLETVEAQLNSLRASAHEGDLRPLYFGIVGTLLDNIAP